MRPFDQQTRDALVLAGIPDNDRDGYYDFGSIFGGAPNLDLDAFLPGHAPMTLLFDAVQMTDDADGVCAGNSPGADIDAICALSSLPSSQENTATTCSDGIDNDGDGLIDCADEDCSGLARSGEGCQSCNNDGLSFADVVISSNLTCPGINPNTNPQDAIGPPNIGIVDDEAVGIVSLGEGGTLSLGFTNNLLTNSGDSDFDLRVFEDARNETFAIELRPFDQNTRAVLILAGIPDIDGDGYYDFGSIFGGTPNLDLDAFLPGHAPMTLLFDAVQMTDDGDGVCAGNSPGADIDAICALFSSPFCEPGEDTEAPQVDCPGSVTLFKDYCNNYLLTPEALGVTAIDNCPGPVNITVSPSEFSAEGIYNIQVTATDAVGNSNTSCQVTLNLENPISAVNITNIDDDLGSIPPNTSITISSSELLSNDITDGAFPIELVEVSLVDPTQGTIVDNNGIYTFTPAIGFEGEVQFSYVTTTNSRIVQCEITGHYYFWTTVPGISWQDARDLAARNTLNGQSGYLPTITSQAENQCVVSISGPTGWIGASDAETEGQWKWVTGPEANTQFWQGSTAGRGGMATNGMYTNWAASEPNGEFITLDEDYAFISNDNMWYDAIMDHRVNGFVMEWGPIDGGCDFSKVRTRGIARLLVNNNEVVAENDDLGASCTNTPITIYQEQLSANDRNHYWRPST